MTSKGLARLNRRIDLVYRHLLGDPAYKIAERYGITHQAVSRGLALALKDQHVVRAAKALKAQREYDPGDEPTRQDRAQQILRGGELRNSGSEEKGRHERRRVSSKTK